MRALLALVIGMGVLIVVGVAVIIGTIFHRMTVETTAPRAAILLDEPAGTRIAAIAPAGKTLGLLLQGGGADRILFIDPATGRTTGHVALAH